MTLGLLRAILMGIAMLVILPAAALAAQYGFGPTVDAGPVTEVYDAAGSACEDPPPDVPTPPSPPDLGVRAYRNTDNSVSLTLPRSDRNRRMVGPDLDHLTLDCDITLNHRGEGGGVTNERAWTYESMEWVAAPYWFNGRLISLVADDYQGHRNPDWPSTAHCPLGSTTTDCWERRVTLATSSNDGETWEHEQSPPAHRVANVPYAYSAHPHWGYLGYFPTNIVRGREQENPWYYTMLNAANNFRNQADLREQLNGVCVMRTHTPDIPSSWRAWGDGNGVGGNDFDVEFVNPYASDPPPGEDPAPSEPADPWRHVCMPLNNAPLKEWGNPDVTKVPKGPEWDDFGGSAFVPHSLTFNTYFDKYLLVGIVGDAGVGFKYYYLLSDDLLDWSPRELLMETPPIGDLSNPDSRFYDPSCEGEATPVARHLSLLDPSDPSDRSFEFSDQTVYLYFMRAFPPATGCPPTGVGTLVRVPITFGARTVSGGQFSYGGHMSCPGTFDGTSLGGAATFQADPLSYDAGPLGGYRATDTAATQPPQWAYGVIDKHGQPYACEYFGQTSPRPSFSLAEGTEVSYSAAFKFPTSFWSEMNKPPADPPLRQIRFLRLGGADPVRWAGMFNVDRTGRLRFTTRPSEPPKHLLMDSLGAVGAPLPQDDRWHIIQVHQVLSTNSATAVNEVSIDGVRQNTAYNEPNLPPSPQTYLRAGIVETIGDIYPSLILDWVKFASSGH